MAVPLLRAALSSTPAPFRPGLHRVRRALHTFWNCNSGWPDLAIGHRIVPSRLSWMLRLFALFNDSSATTGLSRMGRLGHAHAERSTDSRIASPGLGEGALGTGLAPMPVNRLLLVCRDDSAQDRHVRAFRSPEASGALG